MRGLAKELQLLGILVNLIKSRVIESRLLAVNYLTKESLSALAVRIPVGSFGTGEERANLVYFLATLDNSYIQMNIKKNVQIIINELKENILKIQE